MTKTDICNLALTILGVDRIMSIDEDSEGARKLKAVYIPMRDEVLRSHPWNFAITRASLALLSATPAFGYDNYHQLPGDCLRPILIHDGSNPITDYKIEGRRLLSNNDTVYIKYVKRETNEALYDPNFATVLAARLAAEVAYPLTGKETLQKTLFTVYEEKLNLAKGVDAQESPDTQVEGQDVWLEARE